MDPKMHIYINLMFVLLFVIILIDVKQKKNIELAQNAIIVFIVIMLLKILLWGYEMNNGKKDTCDIVKDWFDC
jgi:cytochrome c biogenesis factor